MSTVPRYWSLPGRNGKESSERKKIQPKTALSVTMSKKVRTRQKVLVRIFLRDPGKFRNTEKSVFSDREYVYRAEVSERQAGTIAVQVVTVQFTEQEM